MANSVTMKRKIYLLLIAVGGIITSNAQVFSESFNAPFTPANSNWVVQNNSAPTSTIDWFQGNGVSTFSAYAGGINDYFAANYNSTGAASAPGTISNWLITPPVTLINGATISFATRTASTPTVYPDRLQVYVCNTNTYNLPTGATSVGSFSLIFDVNNTLSTATTAVQTGSLVAGYPQVWTVYTATVTGIPSSVSGRVAFRYFVTNAGAVGVNGNYIGLDEVKVNLPCTSIPTFSVSQTATAGVCGGSTVGLTATNTGSIGANSFTWNTGANSASTVVSPTTTTTYTVSGTSSAGCVSSQTIAVTVSVTPNLTVPSFTICSGATATLQASGATSYSWSNNSSTLSSIAISPTATTVYTVTGVGSATNCPAVQMATVTIGSQLSMNVSASSAGICAGKTVTVSVSTAGTFSWNTGSTSTSFTASPSTTTVYSVVGGLLTGTNVCAGSASITINVYPLPVLSVSQNSMVCSGNAFSATASGAGSYAFMFPAFTLTSNPASYLTSSLNNSVSVQYSVVGTSTDGCTASSGPYSFVIQPAPVVSISYTNLAVCKNSTVNLMATGANSYAWAGSSSSTNSLVSFLTGSVTQAYSFSVTGTSSVSGCTGMAAVTLSVSDCAGVSAYASNNSQLNAYPNPFNHELTFTGFEGRLEIYNSVGQLVLSVEAIAGSTKVSTSELANGIYILKAFGLSGQTEKTLKLIKN